MKYIIEDYYYLDYKCYQFLKPRFEKIQVGDYSEGYFNEVYNDFKLKNERHNFYRPLFYELISHITNNHVFYQANPRIPCKFVNYLLNYKLRKTEHLHNDIADYAIYQKFLKDFIIKYRGKYYPNQVCDVYLEEINEDIFKRMEILYQLYDDYDGLEKTKENGDNTPCNNLSRLASFFNDAATNHGTKDSKLHTRLTDLKNLIKDKISSSYYNTCDTKINFFYLQDPSTSDQKETTTALSHANVHHDPALKSPGAPSKIQEKSVLKEDPPERREKEVRDDLYTSRSSEHSEEVKSINLSHHSPVSVSLNTRESEKAPTIHESVTPLVSGSFHRLGRSHAQIPEEPDILMEEGRGHIVGETYQPDYRPSNLADKKGGVSEILSSIGGVLGEVDPAPVLGVSGGMGVLFILFKVFKF
ncbi:hypothetical protein PVNG_06413 [Plasmodium vivax North Korean]|uniref:VIR protein n=1 Tax=Plasmodium vivax North Korean TaxID=1035514 RepID=A0A0J9U189_PLAVI|nr:hypothetical protein PVNG_06413 [Plasmodium vivax North Korean]